MSRYDETKAALKELLDSGEIQRCNDVELLAMMARDTSLIEAAVYIRKHAERELGKLLPPKSARKRKGVATQATGGAS